MGIELRYQIRILLLSGFVKSCPHRTPPEHLISLIPLQWDQSKAQAYGHAPQLLIVTVRKFSSVCWTKVGSLLPPSCSAFGSVASSPLQRIPPGLIPRLGRRASRREYVRLDTGGEHKYCTKIFTITEGEVTYANYSITNLVGLSVSMCSGTPVLQSRNSSLVGKFDVQDLLCRERSLAW